MCKSLIRRFAAIKLDEIESNQQVDGAASEKEGVADSFLVELLKSGSELIIRKGIDLCVIAHTQTYFVISIENAPLPQCCVLPTRNREC